MDRRPAMRGEIRHWSACLLLLVVCVAPLSGAATRAWAQGNTAVVTGTERVFVRRGPGTEFPPFATLTKGSAVEVQEMQGEWSRVKTAGGQVGYVHSNFLALPSEAGSAAVAETPHAQPTPHPTALPVSRPDAAAVSALSALTEKNKGLEAQLSALQDELTALKNRTAQPTTAAPTPVAASSDAEELRAEIKRLTAAVEGLQRQSGGAPSSNDAPATSAAAEGPERTVPSTALLLGVLGLLVGWLGGAAYGRGKERGRRSRIRF